MSVDWGNSSHAACVVDGNGKELCCFQVDHTDKGLEEIVAAFKKDGPVLGVAVETNHGLLVHKLLEAGMTVYAINPKLSDQWRKGVSVSEAKSDRSDALVLAQGLRLMHDDLRPLELDDPLTRELAMLCRAESSFIHARTSLVLHLQATLKEYYPQALEWFNDWTRPAAWDFVRQFPTPAELQQATRKKLIGFLQTHHLGLRPKWKQKVDGHDRPTAWPSDEPTTLVRSMEAVGLANQLKAVNETLKKHRTRIEQLFSQHPDAHIFDSLPGAGPKLAPRLLAYFGSRRDRYESAQALQQLSGCAPVTRQSGRYRQVRIRRACQAHFRDAMHMFAMTSMRDSPWARAFYDRAKQAGDHHALALRKLAAKWIKIIFRMWQHNSTYDERKYVDSMSRHGSPLVEYMKCA